VSIGRQERFTAEQQAGMPGPADGPIQQPPNVDIKIHCCVCLNQKSERVAATTIIAGYAVCDGHVDLVGNPGFNIHKIKSWPHHKSV
jgi:hypothetical protein